MSFSFSQSGGTVTVSRVELVPGQQVGTLELIAQPVSPGQVLQVPGLTVAGYAQIAPVGVNPSAIDHGTITFGVSGTWLTDHSAAREDIVLMRYHDSRWDALPTRFDHVSGDIFYFNANTPGFSYFAVAVKPADSPAVNASLTKVLTPVVQALVADTVSSDPTHPKLPHVLLAVSQTTTVPAVSPAGGPGIPYMVPAMGLLAGIGLMAGGVVVRRWWFGKQNPVLFHKDR
jgi:PGF-pre-PGF domain-containing protein